MRNHSDIVHYILSKLFNLQPILNKTKIRQLRVLISGRLFIEPEESS